MISNFVKYVLDRGGRLNSLELPYEASEGLGLCNPSLFVTKDGRILCNVRRVNYLFHLNNRGVWNSCFGPSSYHHPDNDVTLTTHNFMCELDEYLNVKPETVKKVDYSKFDTKPRWDFIGEEDVRIVDWDGHVYLTGCRRDTDEKGTSRMELSEINKDFVEIGRTRVPAPGKNDTYCEKNWMPVLDEPYTYVKWCNPLEIVKYDTERKVTESIVTKNYKVESRDPLADLRGSSQVLTTNDGWHIAMVHEVNLWVNRYNEKNANYYTRFIVWDKDWNLLKLSDRFWFLGYQVEFGVGMIEREEDFVVSFAIYDNAPYTLSIPKKVLFGYIGLEGFPEVHKVLERTPTRNIYERYAANDTDYHLMYEIGLDYYRRKQYGCAYPYFMMCAEKTADNKTRYRDLSYNAFYMCMKCHEMLGNRVEKLVKMYGQLIDWDSNRYQAYYELSKLHYGMGQNKNDHNIAFMFASLAKSKLDNIVQVEGMEEPDDDIVEDVMFQYYICGYRCSKDYMAVEGLRDLLKNGSVRIQNIIKNLGLNL